jgi:hypothetical protein
MQAHEREALYFDMPPIIPKPKRDDAAETSAQIRSRGMRMKVRRVSGVYQACIKRASGCTRRV